ncbi:MAG: tRNA (adenosine(37)-N6)-threonylcarbamoyltransferase complex dimerization subunit type 1 TsaB [Deltaproteobacteria bacterium]|nr:tRNA (adenosine(37)-N6)-threonylcarbamoyltransferase complex dimerization subunit type 1 TsaB [Deltaproteobacteria bacterium]
MGNKYILAIDNSLEYLCISLSLEDEIVEERKIKNRQSPSQIIGEEVLELLGKQDLKPGDLSLLLCTTGPGSFTGIRVALAFLKGMKVGLNIPLVGVPTLDCLAQIFSFMRGFYIFPMIDAKKGEVFCALYLSDGRKLERLTSYEAKKPFEIKDMIMKPCVILGSGVKLIKGKIDEDVIMASELFKHVPMATLVKLGLERVNEGNQNILPVYGRRSEAELKYGVNLT